MLCSTLNSQTQHRFSSSYSERGRCFCFFYSVLLCFTVTKLPVRLDHGHAPMEPTSAISHTCGRIQVLCEPRPYFSWSGCFTSKVFLSDLWWWGRGSCSRISAQPAPVTTKVMVIPLRAGEREEERDSYFTAHCVRHTPHGCFEACAQARSGRRAAKNKSRMCSGGVSPLSSCGSTVQVESFQPPNDVQPTFYRSRQCLYFLSNLVRVFRHGRAFPPSTSPSYILT